MPPRHQQDRARVVGLRHPRIGDDRRRGKALREDIEQAAH